MSKRYPIPAAETRAEIGVKNSRFIATAVPAFTVEQARAFIARIKAEFNDATHNVPAFLVGFGNSVTAHCNDDGEPSGTAGRPILAVLQGSGLGDIAVVVTRYYGGTKLGTGGLVRAYGDATKAVLESLPRAEKVPTHTVMVALPYSLLERLRLLVAEWNGRILDEQFAADITMTMQFTVAKFPGFQDALRELSHGTLAAEIIETNEDTIMPLGSFDADSGE
ncbi:MAG: YigZ family protein [Ardenticatenaceae bacterium]|nr:MAG: YigZ family protein [Ardenticatenaceae bacterium]